ncbi:hypothetical protein P3W45_000629 [Vairimorpha bombi]|jgi:hypothetical protein
MNDLTKYYRILHSVHSESIKESKIYVLSNARDIESIHPLIVKHINRNQIFYSDEYKNVQKRLVEKIKDFLYNESKDFVNLIFDIKSANKELYNIKNDINTIPNFLNEQDVINKRVLSIINSYIKKNLLINSYLKNLEIIYRNDILEDIEIKEANEIKRRIHNSLI